MENSVITNIIPQFAGTIVEHILSPFQLDNMIRDLESATRDLVALKDDVKTIVEITERQNGFRTNQFVEWLNKAEAIEKEAEEIKENNHKRRRSFWSNYTTSRSAVKKLRQVKNLCDQKATIEVTMHLPPPLSKSPNLESALHAIRDDVHGIIGIWGMGGVGKTHLLELINNELSRDPAFQLVVFITCSRDCSVEKVQNEIIAKLRLDKSDSAEQKRRMIHSFLRERSFVLLLDNLWTRVDLQAVGIPDPMSAISTCKRRVVLTTRSTEVCGQMEVCKRISVNVLNWDDAWSLFKRKVTEETIDSDPLIQKAAVDVVKELGGLPSALITVGRTMRHYMDPSEWEHVVMLLKQARLHDVEFSGANQSIFHTLSLSYDSLKNDALRLCFLHCSLWPRDYQIQKNDLVELWMGLGLIDEPEIQAAYRLGYIYIRRLQAVCLLEINSDDTIKMHNVIRGMALWIANNQGVDTNKWSVQAGRYKGPQEIEVSCDTETLSVMDNRATKVSLSIACSPTKLSTLLLNHNCLNHSKNLRLELFPELTILDLSHNLLEDFPVEVCKLVHLQYLNLSSNPLKSLPEELAALTSLKYLLLRRTECSFPKGVLSKLKALRVLDISRRYQAINDSLEFQMLEDELQCLPKFQALGITISSTLVFQKLSLTENVPLRWLDVCNFKGKCLSFSKCFLGNSQLQNNLGYLGIRYMDDVQSVRFENTSETGSTSHLGRLQHLYFGEMENMKEVMWKSLDPMDIFPRLQVVEFRNCPQLITISWVANLRCIQQVRVINCNSMKQLMDINELRIQEVNAIQHPFPALKIMHLWGLYELESISDAMVAFPALEILEVSGCDKLQHLPFTPSNLPRKLKLIRGSPEWWSNIEMGDASQRSSLLPFFKMW